MVAPQAPLADELGGFSWWKITENGSECKKAATFEDLQLGMGSLEKFLNGFLELYPALKNKPIIASGFSQGAGLLSVLSLEKPSLFSSVSLLCGFIPGYVYEKSYAAESLPKYFIFHGIEDKIIPIGKAKRAKDFLLDLGAEVDYMEDQVGHKVSSKGIKALDVWAS